MPDPTIEQLIEAREGARIAAVMPDIEARVEKMNKFLLSRAFASINDGTLTPDEAYRTLIQLHANAQLLRGLSSQVKMGVSTGKNIAEAMKLEK